MKTEITALKNSGAVDLMGGYFTVAEAAEKLGVSGRRIRQYISEGRLRARKVGKQYIISTEALGAFTDKPRKVGRPLGSKNKIKLPDTSKT